MGKLIKIGFFLHILIKEYKLHNSNLKYQFIFLDSTPFMPFERNRYPYIQKESREERENWLKNVLEEGKDKFHYRFLITHHPFYNAAHHGESGHKFMKKIEDLIYEYKIPSVFTAHEHNLQYLYNNNTNFFISGGGGGADYNLKTDVNLKHNKLVFGKNSFGFMALTLSKDYYDIEFIDEKGKILFYKRFLNKKYK
jgi:hypothetical protein